MTQRRERRAWGGGCPSEQHCYIWEGTRSVLEESMLLMNTNTSQGPIRSPKQSLLLFTLLHTSKEPGHSSKHTHDGKM